MPEQLEPPATEVAAPPVAGDVAATGATGGSVRELVDRAPEEAGEAVAANEKAWQAALRAKANAEPALGKRLKAAGLIGTPISSGSDFLWDPDDVLEVGPVQKEVIRDLNWGQEQFARGAFDAYRGQLVAIVNKTVLGVGRDEGQLVAEAVAKTGVAPHRVAIFDVDSGEF
ncbi:MAG TPA: hypothetical protein VKA46_07755 [Gemmataceae bacterium]|nr:hypothetical protein [Gemmataceae bacterium]